MTMLKRVDSYQVDVTGKNGKRIRVSVSSPEEAKLKEASLVLQLAEDTPKESQKASLAGFSHVRFPTKVETLGIFTP